MTSSDKMKDDIVELLLKTGRTFSIWKTKGGKQKFKNGEYNCVPVWQIQSYLKNQERALLQPAKTVKGKVTTYDVTVPSRRIYVIRNGKGCWSSNCKRVLDAGYKVAFVPGVYVVHNHRTTFKSVYSKDEIRKMQAENAKKLKEKHGSMT